MKKGRLKRITDSLRNNADAKALSIVLAIVIFYAIRSTIGNREEFSVPVEVKVGSGVAILEQDHRVVRVTFEGSRAELRRLADEPLVAVVSPPGGANNETIRIRSRHISGRTIARVVSIVPPVIHVKYDRESKKIMPVARPATRGTPLRGQITLDYKPRVVEVTGPQRQMEQLLGRGYQVQTEPIDVEGRVQSFTRVVALLPPEDVVVSAIEPSTVEVRVTIETETQLSEVPAVPVMAAYVPEDTQHFAFDPTNVVVRLSGRQEVLDGVDRATILALADCRNLEPGEHELPVRVFVPPGVDLVSVDAVPASVRVLVSNGDGVSNAVMRVEDAVVPVAVPAVAPVDAPVAVPADVPAVAPVE